MAPLVLLDTDTLSEVMKGKNTNVAENARHYLKTHGQFRISVITRYEILRGLKAKQAERQIAIFEDRCNKSYVYPVTDDIVMQASDIYAYLYRRGLLINDADILIAATALIYNLILITGNVDHFNRVSNLICSLAKTPSFKNREVSPGFPPEKEAEARSASQDDGCTETGTDRVSWENDWSLQRPTSEQ